LPYESRFDFVLSWNVIHHGTLGDVGRHLSEIWRVLNLGRGASARCCRADSHRAVRGLRAAFSQTWIDLPMFRDENGTWRHAITLPDEICGPIGRAVLVERGRQRSGALRTVRPRPEPRERRAFEGALRVATRLCLRVIFAGATMAQ
jgi:hypothetical protein